MHQVAALMGAERGTLYIYDRNLHELRPLHADDVAEGKIVVPLKMGVIGAAILRRQCINIVNAHEHTFFNDITERRSAYRTDTLLAQPVLSHDGHILDGLELINKFGGRFKTNRNWPSPLPGWARTARLMPASPARRFQP